MQHHMQIDKFDIQLDMKFDMNLDMQFDMHYHKQIDNHHNYYDIYLHTLHNNLYDNFGN